ncbi:VanZ family protein [Actinoplanes sp. TFC3]|uniref:VanZ family protein n=1 Tax=Actinoplanes sp. TFC3 TaxID=1710355 RepID=UPI0008363FF5|nr:VanZ family protein [Actinoplanes sp. TFC3]
MLNEDMVLSYLAMTAVWKILLVSAVAAAALGRRLAARYNSPTMIAVLFILAVGCVMALTAPPGTSLPASEVIDWYTHGEAYRDLLTSHTMPQDKANIIMFLPIGFLGCLLTRRIFRTIFFGAGFSLAIEVWQTFMGRSGDIMDLRNNTIGAIIGSIAAIIILQMRRKQKLDSTASTRDPSSAATSPARSTACSPPATR